MTAPGERRRLAVHALRVLWPAFFMAGVAEMLVFAVLDPMDLRWFGGEPLGLGRQAVYTLTFLIFWLLFSVGASVTLLLSRDPQPGAEAP